MPLTPGFDAHGVCTCVCDLESLMLFV